ncbi:MAG: hypothetical protein ACRERV_10180 [Methylococcales bacterium]
MDIIPGAEVSGIIPGAEVSGITSGVEVSDVTSGILDEAMSALVFISGRISAIPTIPITDMATTHITVIPTIPITVTRPQ